jgi:hypothetical protein
MTEHKSIEVQSNLKMRARREPKPENPARMSNAKGGRNGRNTISQLLQLMKEYKSIEVMNTSER